MTLLEETKIIMRQCFQAFLTCSQLPLVRPCFCNNAEEVAALNVPVEHQHHFTDPGSTICEVAEEWNADLISLGRHDRAEIVEFFAGSVGNHMMHRANCSVLAIKLASEDNSSNLTDKSKLELNTPQLPSSIGNSRHDSDSDDKK